MAERKPRAKSPVGRMLSLGNDDEAKATILKLARGDGKTPPATSDQDVCARLGVHRQSLWRYLVRLKIRDELEAIYTSAQLGAS